MVTSEDEERVLGAVAMTVKFYNKPFDDITRKFWRQWIRQHPKEISQGKQKAHAKKLFRYLSDLDRAEPSTF